MPNPMRCGDTSWGTVLAGGGGWASLDCALQFRASRGEPPANDPRVPPDPFLGRPGVRSMCGRLLQPGTYTVNGSLGPMISPLSHKPIFVTASKNTFGS